MTAAREIGCAVKNVETIEEFESACMKVLLHIQGLQDRDHARYGIRSAIVAARAGNLAYARGGLWEARKVLELAHYGAGPTADPLYTT